MNSTAEEMNDEFEKEAGRKSNGAGGSVDGGAPAGSGGADFRESGKA